MTARRGAPPAPSPARLAALAGVVAAVTATAPHLGISIAVVPLTLTAVLVCVAPHGPFARPRAVLLGYTAALALGTALAYLAPPPALAAALAAGLLVATLQAADAVHPPAAALAVLLARGEPARLDAVALLGAAILLATATTTLAQRRDHNR